VLVAVWLAAIWLMLPLDQPTDSEEIAMSHFKGSIRIATILGAAAAYSVVTNSDPLCFGPRGRLICENQPADLPHLHKDHGPWWPNRGSLVVASSTASTSDNGRGTHPMQASDLTVGPPDIEAPVLRVF
jgi:hypothetical protein